MEQTQEEIEAAAAQQQADQAANRRPEPHNPKRTAPAPAAAKPLPPYPPPAL